MSTSLAVPQLSNEQRQSLSDPRSPYSPEDRIAIAMCWIVEGGVSTKAADAATLLIQQEVKAGTIRQWVRRASWWAEVVQIARKMLQQELDNKYTKFIIQTEREMVERVTNGNTVVHNGELVKVPVALRDLVNAHGIIVDKRAMIRGEPTSRKEDTGVDLIKRLAEALQTQGEKTLTETAVEGEWEEVND